MNDELWNLMPMDSSLNSSKSNKLPKWDPFFNRFAANQYMMYDDMIISVQEISSILSPRSHTPAARPNHIPDVLLWRKLLIRWLEIP